MPSFVANEILHHFFLVSGTKSTDDTKTLSQSRFTIGDYVDISIIPAGPGGSNRFDDRDHRRDGDRGGNRRRGGGGGRGFGGDRRPRPY